MDDQQEEEQEAGEDAQPTAKRLGVIPSDSTTPARPSSASASAAPASSPTAVSSSAVRAPAHTQTPMGVSELKRGTHQIIGIITRKIIFSKRPEPVVNIEPQSSDEGEDEDDEEEEEAA